MIWLGLCIDPIIQFPIANMCIGDYCSIDIKIEYRITIYGWSAYAIIIGE